MPLLPEIAAHDYFCPCPPGLEPLLAGEMAAHGLQDLKQEPGGVAGRGAWRHIVRANVCLRGATRVLVRIAKFRVSHLAQLEKRLREVAWTDVLTTPTPVALSVACARSKLYHEGAVKERFQRSIAAALGAPAGERNDGGEAGAFSQSVYVRIDKNVCTVSLDTSGEPLYKRGFKTAVAKAPLRETMAALFLRACDYKAGTPLLDPMCGSGTFMLEAGDMALGLPPGRARRFGFEAVLGHDPGMLDAVLRAATPVPVQGPIGPICFGRDQDAGAVAMAAANLERAGLEAVCEVSQQAIAQARPPQAVETPGLIIINPPYGARIGGGPGAALRGLYATIGRVLRERFSGWRAAVITSDPSLIQATRLPVTQTSPPVPHGGLQVRLYQTDALS